VAHARSRRAFLSALEHFERVLALAPDYPPGCLSSGDGEELGGVAAMVIAHIEQRLAHHTDRAAVQRVLEASVAQIRFDLVRVRGSLDNGDGLVRARVIR